MKTHMNIHMKTHMNIHMKTHMNIHMNIHMHYMHLPLHPLNKINIYFFIYTVNINFKYI
jgi:hypothetical protein